MEAKYRYLKSRNKDYIEGMISEMGLNVDVPSDPSDFADLEEYIGSEIGRVGRKKL
jgi:hypothetical protein